MRPVPATIEEKIDAALQGDASAFGSLFQWYKPGLLAQALRICGNTPLAQEALQETFISAFTHYPSLREPGSFYPWLKRILLNHCYRLIRNEKKTVAMEGIAKNDNIIERSIEEKFEKIANKQWVYTALEKLSDELRVCVMIRYFSNFKSYESIAAILGIPVGTVRSRLAAAKEKLLKLHQLNEDTSDQAFKESMEWSEYYKMIWGTIYDNTQVRNEMMAHLHPFLNVRFTSGKTGKGRNIISHAISEDIRYGSYLCPQEISSSGDISILEGINFNSSEHPDHCPPSTVLVFQRRKDKIVTCNIFDSLRNTD